MADTEILSREEYSKRLAEIKSEHSKNAKLIKNLQQKNLDLASEELRLIKSHPVFYGTEFEQKP